MSLLLRVFMHGVSDEAMHRLSPDEMKRFVNRLIEIVY